MCVYVCVYIYIYMYTHINNSINSIITVSYYLWYIISYYMIIVNSVYICIYVYTRVCVYIYTHMYTYICIYIYIYIYIYIHITCIHTQSLEACPPKGLCPPDERFLTDARYDYWPTLSCCNMMCYGSRLHISLSLSIYIYIYTTIKSKQTLGFPPPFSSCTTLWQDTC